MAEQSGASAQPILSKVPGPAKLIGPLLIPRTITIAMAPNFNQRELKSPLRPTSMCIILGPADATPETALWKFELNVYAVDQLTGPSKEPGEETIPKGQRGLLLFDGKVYPTYAHAVVAEGCKLSTTDELKTLSVVIRPHNPGSLIYVRRRPDEGYLQIVQGCHYFINITFAVGSLIAQMVGLGKWRPKIFLTTKRPEHEDTTPMITGIRKFGNFVPTWAKGAEVHPDDHEQQQALNALLTDEKGNTQSEMAAAVSQFDVEPVQYNALDMELKTMIPSAVV